MIFYSIVIGTNSKKNKFVAVHVVVLVKTDILYSIFIGLLVEQGGNVRWSELKVISRIVTVY